MENLKNKTSSVDETKADDAFYTRETEITELESLIPEIEEKIQDTKDMQKQGKEQTENGFKSKLMHFYILSIVCSNTNFSLNRYRCDSHNYTVTTVPWNGCN